METESMRSRTELRLPERLKEHLEKLAASNGRSLNQLISAMLDGLVRTSHQGWPEVRGSMVTNHEDQEQNGSQPLWFGYETEGPDDPGEVWFRIPAADELTQGRPILVVRPEDVR